MDLEDVVPLDCCRLVKYDEFHEYLERSYEGEEDMPMGLLLGGVKSSYMFDLLLETRRPDQVFQPYKPGGKRYYRNTHTCSSGDSYPYLGRTFQQCSCVVVNMYF